MSEVMKIDYSVSDVKDYRYIDSYFLAIPDIIKPLSIISKNEIIDITSALRVSPAFINVVKSLVPEEMLVAVFTDEQMKQIAEGAIEILTKKNGALMANLRDSSTKKIVSTIDLKKVKFSPELSTSMMNLSNQIQMAQIAEKIDQLHEKVEQVKNGLETDRLATAYSLQQKFLHACSIKNPSLRSDALLRVAFDAEDSRNILMLSQTNNLRSLLSQPKSIPKKFKSHISTKNNDETIGCLRESMCALNMVSMVESLTYQALGEPDLAVKAMNYHTSFMEKIYGNKETLNRLDGLDPETTKYWTQILPSIQHQMKQLPKTDWYFIEHKNEED